MNTMQAARERAALLDLVDFKWLMAGVGWWVNLARLQRDKAYADECLQRASSSGSGLLREHAARLLGLQRSAGAHGEGQEPPARAALAA